MLNQQILSEARADAAAIAADRHALHAHPGTGFDIDYAVQYVTRRLTELVVKTAAGQPTKSEAQGHHEFFVPYKYQEKQVAFRHACEE